MGDGLNLYTYCNNNPVYYLDPSGNVCKALYKIYKELRNKGYIPQQSKNNLDYDKYNILKKAFNLSDNYKLSNKTFYGHIIDRHGPNFTKKDKSKFIKNFDIKKEIQKTLNENDFVIYPNTNN